MDRVDYLSCRVGQLRRTGASHVWATWLARLELGERPAGQSHPPIVSQSTLFRLLRRDIADASEVVWRSPAPIRDHHGRVLALLLRCATTGKDYRGRTGADGVSILSSHTLPIVAPAFGLVVSRSDGPLPRTREFEYWLLRNAGDIAASQLQLLPYVDGRNVAGFASYD